MSTVIIVLAIIFGIILAACIFCICLEGALNSINSFRDRLCWDARDNERREIGALLIQESYWFGEDKSAQYALLTVGDELAKRGQMNAQQSRNRWREKMNPTPTKEESGK